MSAVNSRGEEALREVRGRIGDKLFRRSLASIGSSVRAQDVVRVLGLGSLLTEFMIAPCALPPDKGQRTVQLGSWANLIVSVYDQIADGQPEGYRCLRKEWIDPGAAIGIVGRIARFGRNNAHTMEPLMRALVGLYLKELHRLAQQGHARAPRIELSIRKMIVRMYEAEVRSVRLIDGISPVDWRTKSALPFVVMSLPAWLSVLPARADATWHARWAYRIGLLVGKIDDAVDSEIDRLRGHPNLLNAFLRRSKNPSRFLARLRESVPRSMSALMREWDAKVGGDALKNPVVAQALPVTLLSWFGGPGWRPASLRENYGGCGAQSACSGGG
jgi:hypothetical protein